MDGGAFDYRLRPPGLYRCGALRTRPPARLSRFWQETVFIIVLTGTGSIYHGGRSGHACRVVARTRRPRTAGTSPPARCSQLTARTTGSTPGDTTIMNKQLIAAPLLLSLAGIAAAQSSVTLYGIVDAGVTYRSNERVGSAGAYTGHSSVGHDRQPVRQPLGIKGSEDLGGGMRALFVLENGFDITNGTSGQGGRQFGRQAFVGLGSDRYGTVTLGRQYTSLDDFVSPVGPSSYIGGFGAHPGDIDDLDQTARVDSSINTSANYSGFTFGALYGFGSQPGSMKQRNTWSVGAAYAAAAARRRRLRAVGQQQDGCDRPDGRQVAEHRRRAVQLVDQRRLCERAIAADHRDRRDLRLRAGRRRREHSNVQYRSGGQSLFTGHATFNVAGVFTLERAPADATVRGLQLHARQRCRRRGRPRAVSQRHARRRMTCRSAPACTCSARTSMHRA